VQQCSTSVFCSDTPENTLVCANLEKALDVLSKPPYDQSIENLYVIGGQSVFKVLYLYI
jgi:dihydrofolate reductase